MTTEIQRIAKRHASVDGLLAELRIRAEATSIQRPDPSKVSEEREPAYHHLARLTKPYLGVKFAGVRWSVIGEAALVNFGSSHLPKTIDILVDLRDKQVLEEYFDGREITKVDGGDFYGFKFTVWQDIVVYYHHLQEYPELAKTHCITTKKWPLCNHATVIAFTLLNYSKQNLANVVDVMVGGLQIDWPAVKYWLDVFGEERDCEVLEKIEASITQDEEVWGDLIF